MPDYPTRIVKLEKYQEIYYFTTAIKMHSKLLGLLLKATKVTTEHLECP